MTQALYRLSHNFTNYKEIRDLLRRPIDASKLPLVGEGKIFKMSASRYGHVIIRLDIEKEASVHSISKFHYSWKSTSDKIFPNGLISLTKNFEQMIVKELQVFVMLLDLLNDDLPPLRFSVIGGTEKTTERPYFDKATAMAIVEIFKKLHSE